MSNTVPIYANVPTLSDRAFKKPRASVQYGRKSGTHVKIVTPEGVTFVFLCDQRGELEEAKYVHDYWWGYHDFAAAEVEHFQVSMEKIRQILSATHFGHFHDRIHQGDFRVLPSAPLRVRAELPRIVEAPMLKLSSLPNEDRAKKPLEWAEKVYTKSWKTLRDSVVHLIEAKGHENSFKDIATNGHTGSKARFDALLDWLLEEKAEASAYVLHELSQATDSWLDALVHASLDTFFDSERDRGQMADLLLKIAAERRQDNDASAASVTRVAILRAGSLLDSAEINRLRPFLSESKSNLVALVAMLRIVSNDPPEEFNHDELIQDLRNTVLRYSDPVTYRRGDIDAALFNALELLAIYSPEGFNESLDDFERLNKPYLLEQLREELVELQSNWQAATDSIAGQNLVQAIKRVHQRTN